MIVPKIDRKSAELSKQIMEHVRAVADRELRKQQRTMPPKERAKLSRFLANVKFCGDVSKAANRSRVSRKLLTRWMETSGVSWHINIALNEAQALLHSEQTADDVLWWWKIAPLLAQDAEFFRATGQRNRESRVIAKMAARDLKLYRWHIVQAATNDDKHFIIDLEKCLSGEMSTDFFSKFEYDVADICCNNPTISANAAVQELENRGHQNISPSYFRLLRSRLSLSKAATAKRNNSF